MNCATNAKPHQFCPHESIIKPISGRPFAFHLQKRKAGRSYFFYRKNFVFLLTFYDTETLVSCLKIKHYFSQLVDAPHPSVNLTSLIEISSFLALLGCKYLNTRWSLILIWFVVGESTIDLITGAVRAIIENFVHHSSTKTWVRVSYVKGAFTFNFKFIHSNFPSIMILLIYYGRVLCLIIN